MGLARELADSIPSNANSLLNSHSVSRNASFLDFASARKSVGDEMSSTPAEGEGGGQMVSRSSVTGLGEKAKVLLHWGRQAEAQDWKHRISWLLNRFPQLESASSLPLLKTYLPSLPLLPPDTGVIEIPALRVSRHGSIAIVTINRPQRANAYDTAMLQVRWRGAGVACDRVMRCDAMRYDAKRCDAMALLYGTTSLSHTLQKRTW